MPCSTTALLLTLALLPQGPSAVPPSRALLKAFTERARVAGTSGSEWGGQWVAAQLEEAGWEVELDERVVLLSLPRRIEVGVYGAAGVEFSRRVERYDPDAIPPGEIPPCLAWSAEGRVDAPVVDAGRGLRADFEALKAAGVELEGSIAIARYGGSYRGVKAQLAEEYGCVGLALFSESSEDGVERGPSWPEGPWKNDSHCQRGSILPIANTPGDPSTPGWPSPAPGEEGRRLDRDARNAALPGIPAVPIPMREARLLLEHLDGSGPGPARLELVVEQPRELRTIVNVVARLEGDGDGLVIAGNHRDAWVRGAHDAGSGTITLLRAAQRLAARRADGWIPQADLLLAFWDAEETGLVGSTEWVEANAEMLTERLVAYVNADAAVSGPDFAGASGVPGLDEVLARALARVPADGYDNQLERFRQVNGKDPSLGLAGSGSDYTAFLHHLCLPVLDFSFGGNGGGQYHTRFDDFAQVDRFLDPGFVGHERASQFVEELLVILSNEGADAFDEELFCERLAGMTRDAAWLGGGNALSLAEAFESLAESLRETDSGRGGRLLAELAVEGGLPGRPWFKNPLWAPGLETGYAPEFLPLLALAAQQDGDALVEATRAQIAALAAIEQRVVARALDVRDRAPMGR
ncbi:MAG: M28 family peptidase [Planctomycetes bacterium]|nr:M28 family peptidase [Planctomycetota bacterium]MCB9905794.1 M28 family peptidase [Planctomycetota bacterium]